MSTSKKYDHTAEAAARREAWTVAVADQERAAQRLETAQDASRDVAQRLGTGDVDAHELTSTDAELRIAQAQADRAEHLVQISTTRLLNESVDIAERILPAVHSLVVGIKTVEVLAHEPKAMPEGNLPVAATCQTRQSVAHPSGYVYTHAAGYSGASTVKIHLWTTTGLHIIPAADQVARALRAVQVSTGAKASDPVEVLTTIKGDITETTYSLKVTSCWPELPKIDLSSPWFDPRQKMSLPISTALAVPGLPSSVTYSSSHSKIVTSTVDKYGLRSTTVELTLGGASSALAVETSTKVIEQLARTQVGRAHPWLGRCTAVEITNTKAIDPRGQWLDAGRTVGAASGALVTAVLEFSSGVLNG